MQLLEIERELSGEGGLEAMERYDGLLEGLSSRIGEALRKGLAPDEFKKAEMLMEAATTARKLLRLHAKRT